MKTILYNTKTQEIIKHSNKGYYKVDGVRPNLPSYIVELIETEQVEPTNILKYQRLHWKRKVDLNKKEYRNEFTIIDETPPSYDTSTQYVITNVVFDETLKTNRKEFTVVDLTAKELAAKEWKHVDYTKKLTIDEDVAKTSVGVFHFMRFEKNGNPVEYDNVNKKWYVWMQGIDPSYQEDYNALIQSGVLAIANRPAILD